VVENPQKLIEGTEMRQGKVRTKADEDSQGDNGDGGAKKGKKGAKGGGMPGPGGDGIPGGPGPGSKGPVSAGPSQEQIQAFMQQMQNATPEARRDLINNIPDVAKRDQVRQFLRDKGLQVAD
jgi:hypothetical protein